MALLDNLKVQSKSIFQYSVIKIAEFYNTKVNWLISMFCQPDHSVLFNLDRLRSYA